MNMRVKLLFLLLILIESIDLSAQSRTPVESGPNPFWADQSGRPLYLQENYVADGSPYFRDQYDLAEITTVDGKVYKDVQVKVNIMENLVLYLAEDNKEMISTSAIKRIKFYNVISEDRLGAAVLESFDGGLNRSKTPIYQVLDSGAYTLLKKIAVTYRDNKGYGQSLVTRTFETKETYYCLLTDGELVKFKGKEAMLDIFGLKRNKVEAYIDKNDLKCRTDKDFQKVFQYLNSIL